MMTKNVLQSSSEAEALPLMDLQVRDGRESIHAIDLDLDVDQSAPTNHVERINFM